MLDRLAEEDLKRSGSSFRRSKNSAETREEELMVDDEELERVQTQVKVSSRTDPPGSGDSITSLMEAFRSFSCSLKEEISTALEEMSSKEKSLWSRRTSVFGPDFIRSKSATIRPTQE